MAEQLRELDDVSDQEARDKAHHEYVDAGHRPTPAVTCKPESPDAHDVEDKSQHRDRDADRRTDTRRSTDQWGDDREHDVTEEASKGRQAHRDVEDTVRR